MLFGKARTNNEESRIKRQKEQIIVFVYDTNFCQTEEDDPQKAVLFFHPNWVSDQQRLALCGQLMGASQFCSSVFSTPQVLTLQSGKFSIKKFGRYILSVGSDQTLPNWMLIERFNILQSLLEFYHKSFDAILSSVNSEYGLFINKLSEIFEVYIPIIQYIVSTFGNIRSIKFPKRKGTVFLEAFQLLESCCSFEGVLGGTILYNSRVIATQLDADVTKILALTDPYRIKSGAEQIKTPFHLPLGVQLIKVHIRQLAYEGASNVKIAKSAFHNGTTRKQQNIVRSADSRQDKTKIFTVPEEDDGHNISILSSLSEDAKDTHLKEMNYQKNRKCSKWKTENGLKERSKNFVASHNIKVCSTPTIEKKIVHEDLVSICNTPKVEPKSTSQSSVPYTSDLIQAMNQVKQKKKLVSSKYMYNHIYRISMDDLMIDFSYKNYPVPLRYYSFGLPKICKEFEQNEPIIADKQKKRKFFKTRFYKTIADPSNPVFRFDGIPISKSLYKRCLDEHYKDFITANITIDSREEFIRKKNLENELFKSKAEKSEKPKSEQNQRITKETSNVINDKVENVDNLKRNLQLNSSNQKLFRRSLTLPLKPASEVNADGNVSASAVKSKVLHARTPTTPLMTKLSLLALEEKNENKTFPAPIQQFQSKNNVKKNTSLKKQCKSLEKKEPDMVTCGLFVCGQQNLTMLLLLDENVEQSPDLILSLWETCTTNFEKVELLRNKSIDHLSSNPVSNSYSFLSLDPQWGTMLRSGAWGGDDMKIVGSLHQDLIQNQNVTEIIVRNEDAVTYGYRCGDVETFYQQGGCSAIGLPTPGDLMGVVPLKARRRLERDHGVILL